MTYTILPTPISFTAVQYNIVQMTPNTTNGTLKATVVLADGYASVITTKQVTVQTSPTDTTTAILTKILDAVMAL